MRAVTLTTVIDANLEVQESHFGGNAVPTRNTDNDGPLPDFSDAVSELDISYLRYPAGQPDVAYLNGLIIDGNLPQHLVSFLDYARLNNIEVLIVTPTHAAYTGPEDLAQFATLLAEEYSDVVHAFEIGNEYWNHQTETSYGQVANESVLAISDALEDNSIDIPIWVQMGDAAGIMSEFHSSNSDDGWVTRTIEANQLIIDSLSQEAREAIDGVVEHFYLRNETSEIQNDQMISLDYDMWMSTLGNDISLNITEWNVRTSNLNELGMRAASSLLAHFAHLMELGVDEAYVWPPQHNTSSDLAGSGTVVTDESSGIVINSVGGAVFDLMSSSLPGLEYHPSSAEGLGSVGLQQVYSDENTVVVYLSSRFQGVQDFNYSLGSFFEGALLTSAIIIGYDAATSDGMHFNYRTDSWEESVSVMVNGEIYYINEHDVMATVDSLDVSAGNIDDPFNFSLRPYEIIELTYTIPDNLIEGSEEADVLSGTREADLIFLLGGNDIVTSGIGSDTIYGGSGNDSLFGGESDDVLSGGEGNDLLRGEGGNDFLVTGLGQDSIDGGNGYDTLNFGNASDGISVWTEAQLVEVGQSVVEFSNIEIIEGTEYSDRFTVTVNQMEFYGLAGIDFFNLLDGHGNTISSGSGDDMVFINQGANNTIFGGTGDDFILSFGGPNYFDGGEGADEFRFYNQSSDTVVFNEGDGSDVIYGFDVGTDMLHIGNELRTQMSTREEEDATFILFENGDSIELIGVNASQVDLNISFL